MSLLRVPFGDADHRRDDAIRTARPGTTVDKLAARVGVRRNVVVDALRQGVA